MALTRQVPLTIYASDCKWCAVLIAKGHTTQRSGYFPDNVVDTHIAVEELYAFFAGLC